MKKFFIAALALVGMSTSAMAFGYDIEDGITTQVYGGITISDLTNYGDYNAKVGGTIGAKLEYMLPNCYGLYVNAGADWVMKGAQADIQKSVPDIVTGQPRTIEANNTITTNYIQIPIHVGFRYNLSQTLAAYGEFGPYFALGIAGRDKVNIDVDGYRGYETSERAFRSESGLQRGDAGLGIRLGAEYDGHYSINLSMDWGLSDLYTEDFRESYAVSHPGLKLNKVHNFCTAITLGYRF